MPEFHRNASLEDAILSLRKEEDRKDHQDQAAFEREAKEARIKRRGAKEALEQLSVRFGNTLFDSVPKLKECIEEPLKQAFYGKRRSWLSLDVWFLTSSRQYTSQYP